MQEHTSGVPCEGPTALHAHNLTPSEFIGLAVLASAGLVRQRDLARQADIDPRNLGPIVTALTTRGLICARPDAADRRTKRLTLTAPPGGPG